MQPDLCPTAVAHVLHSSAPTFNAGLCKEHRPQPCVSTGGSATEANGLARRLGNARSCRSSRWTSSASAPSYERRPWARTKWRELPKEKTPEMQKVLNLNSPLSRSGVVGARRVGRLSLSVRGPHGWPRPRVNESTAGSVEDGGSS